MGLRYEPNVESRTLLRKNLERLEQEEEIYDLLDPYLPSGFDPVKARCERQNIHSNRFVLKATLTSRTGAEAAFAVKGFSDDSGANIYRNYGKLRDYYTDGDDGLCFPIDYSDTHRTLIFPWVDGPMLSKIVDSRKPPLLRRAARLVANFHRLTVVPDDEWTTDRILEKARLRCERTTERWPQTAEIIEPLWEMVMERASSLPAMEPAAVHGDLGAGQFVWAGRRLVLLDLDTLGYFDPALDVGHILAQLQRRRIIDSPLPAHSNRWLSTFLDTYLQEMPNVSRSSIGFYYGLTLVQKVYTICKRFPENWQEIAPKFAEEARSALFPEQATRSDDSVLCDVEWI